MLKEIETDTELFSLRSKSGYILNIDSVNKVIKLHTTRCRFCDPNEVWGIQVESKKIHQTGETWYSTEKSEADAKAREMMQNRGYEYSACAFCNP